MGGKHRALHGIDDLLAGPRRNTLQMGAQPGAKFVAGDDDNGAKGDDRHAKWAGHTCDAGSKIGSRAARAGKRAILALLG